MREAYAAAPGGAWSYTRTCEVSATYVRTRWYFSKALYAGSDYSYDVVCMGDDSMLSRRGAEAGT